MSNYQRYQPRRRSYRSSTRRWNVLGWSVAIVIVVALAWNGLFGSSGNSNRNENRNAEISLAGTNSNQNTNASNPTVSGREFTVRDCSRAITTATTDQPIAALTLNAGGIAGESQQLIQVLTSNNIPAALFVTGLWAEENPAIVKAYADAGISVYTRGYARTAYATLTAAQIATDVEKAEAALQDAVDGSSKPFIRPPGDVSSSVLTALKAQGYCPILWSVDALDIQSDATVANSVERVTKALKNGTIILMGANSDLALELAPAIAQAVQDEGYRLVPLKDLLRVDESATNTNTSVKANSNANRSTNSAD